MTVTAIILVGILVMGMALGLLVQNALSNGKGL